MTRIVSYGEALVDFLPDRAGVTLRHVETFRKTIGGAPANAAVGLARLGCDVALLGKVGADEFGAYLLDALRDEGVDVRGVATTTAAKTGITFISLDASGDRSFLFFREPSADLTIRREDIDVGVIEQCTVLIAGSNLLTQPGVREATYFLLQQARELGRFVVLDPNVRVHLWPDRETALEHVRNELQYGDVVKLNEEELAFVQPGGSADALWRELADRDVSALVITRAGDGAEVYWPGGHTAVEAPPLTCVDTTGAGDGFVAGFVCGMMRTIEPTDSDMLRREIRTLPERDWQRILRLGCHVGTEVCKKLGATPALPRASDIPWQTLGY